MTQIFDKSFSDMEKFPKCTESNCLQYLELQNRFRCMRCLQIFCCEHRFDFKHNCHSLCKRTVENKPIQTDIILQKCSKPECNCKLTSINKFVCTKCYKTFCMTHRLDFVHKCIKTKL